MIALRDISSQNLPASYETATMGQQEWTFVCNHVYSCYIEDSPSDYDAGGYLTEDCPSCRKRFGEEKKITDQQLKNDEKNLARWEKQRNETQAHLKDARDSEDQETVKELEIMLNSCNKLWARKLPRFMLDQLSPEASVNLSTHTEIIQKRIRKNKERVESLIKARDDLHGFLHTPHLTLLNKLARESDALEGSFFGVALDMAMIEKNLEKIEQSLMELLKSISTTPNPKQDI